MPCIKSKCLLDNLRSSTGEHDAFLWPRSKSLCLENLRETRQSFTSQALQMHNVGLSAFSQPRKTHLYASRSPRGPRVVCLPSGSPDAQCWFECFFPSPKNAFVCFAIAQIEAPELFACPQALQMHNVGLSAFSQPRKMHLYASRSPRGPRVVWLPSGSPDAQGWFEALPSPEKNAFVCFAAPRVALRLSRCTMLV